MKSTIRLIAIDLDGTLLNSQQEITPITRAALQRATKAGIMVVLATGRRSGDVGLVLDQLGMDCPYICSAGSLIRSGKNGEVISARPFYSPRELNQVIDFAGRHGAGLVADFSDGSTRWYGPDWLIEQLDPFTALSVRPEARTFLPKQDFDRPILKMSIAADMGLLEAAEEDVLDGLESIHHVYAGLHYMDLTAQGVDKGSALEIFGRHEGIAAAETAAIGDQAIDLPMFSFSGLSIAMGNAPGEIRRVAHWITQSNDEDGVAEVLMRILEDHS